MGMAINMAKISMTAYWAGEAIEIELFSESLCFCADEKSKTDRNGNPLATNDIEAEKIQILRHEKNATQIRDLPRNEK